MTVYWRNTPIPSTTSWLDRSDGCVLPLGFGTASVLGVVQVPCATESRWSRDRSSRAAEGCELDRRDVAVLGGGVAGLPAAYVRGDLHVDVLDSGDHKGGRTSYRQQTDGIWLNTG